MQDSFQTIDQQLILHIHELENPTSKTKRMDNNNEKYHVKTRNRSKHIGVNKITIWISRYQIKFINGTRSHVCYSKISGRKVTSKKDWDKKSHQPWFNNAFVFYGVEKVCNRENGWFREYVSSGSSAHKLPKHRSTFHRNSYKTG